LNQNRDGYNANRNGQPSSGRRKPRQRRKPSGNAKPQERLTRLFDELQRCVSVDPYQRWHLERSDGNQTTRIIDLVAPIGRGQRCLIVAPPKAGKTMMLMDICRSITENHPEAVLIALLIDERPEEVTHFKRSTQADVFASSSDQTARQHIAVTEKAMEQAIENALGGKDVVLLLDSITRLARAQNNARRGSGRTMSGGLDAETMEFPRRIFGAARKIENGGSLTIIGTALIDTGSRMDQVIFEEFKGTGNTEIMLSRQLFEKRIFPTIDIPRSGTRKEEKLYDSGHLPAIHNMRRVLSSYPPQEAMEGLKKVLEKYPTNAQALEVLGRVNAAS
jgi:transcription termination factor Rho